MKGQEKPFKWLWPEIGDLPSARQAACLGAWAAVILAFVHAVMAMVVFLGNGLEAQPYGRGFFYAGIFILVAFGLFKKSRIAALVGICFFVAEKGFFWIEYGIKPPITTIFFVLFFIGAVRGTFQFQTLRRSSTSGENHPN